MNTKAFHGGESVKLVESDKSKESFVVVFGESNASRTETFDGGTEKCKIKYQVLKSTRSHTIFGAKEVQEVGDSHGGVPAGHTLGGLGIGEKDCFFGKDAKVSLCGAYPVLEFSTVLCTALSICPIVRGIRPSCIVLSILSSQANRH
jgi:hypothetical protein